MRASRLVACNVVIASLLAVFMVGCGSKFSHLVDISIPTTVKSEGFSSEGGTVTITCQVTSDYPITEVTAGIQKKGMTGIPPLSPMSLAEGSTYSATFSVPPNSRLDGQPEEYDVFVRAGDSADYWTTQGLSPAFSVPGHT